MKILTNFCFIIIVLLGCRKESETVNENISFEFNNTESLELMSEKFAVESLVEISEEQIESFKMAKTLEAEFGTEEAYYISNAIQKQNRKFESVESNEISSLIEIGKVLAQNSAQDLSTKRYDLNTLIYNTFGSTSCVLPKRIGKKVKDAGGLLPPKVNNFFYESDAEFPDEVQRLPGKEIDYLLHVVSVLKARSDENPDLTYRFKDYPLSFEGFELKKFIARKSTNLFYTIDCQGYFNAALSVHGGFSLFSNIKAEASNNMNQTTTIMIGYAPVVNPFAQAYFNNLPGVQKLDNNTRLAILKKLLTIEGISDTDTITYTTAYICFFKAKSSESNLNGNVNIALEVKTPAAQVGTSAGNELNKNIKFDIFDTYYVKDGFFQGREQFSVKQLKERIKEIKDEIAAGASELDAS